MVARPGLVRFSARLPCPVCGGWDTLPRGQGRRCGGYLSSDGAYAHCSREEYTGGLLQEDGGTFAHRLEGSCRCGRTHGDAPSAPVVHVNGHPSEQRPREIAVYRYRDAHGGEAFQVLRYRLANGEKTFRQRHLGPDGEWVWKCPERLRVLYRLPELLAAEREMPVFVVEGEKDADALASWGLVATTNPLGAGPGKWLPAYSESLRGRWCILIGDNDGPGRAHMALVASLLRGVASRVQILHLPDLPEHGDVSDWIAAGRSADDLVALVEGVPLESGPPARTFSAAALYDEVLPPTRYAAAGILPEGVTICAGRPKQGKSFLVLNLAIAIAAGVPALGDLAVEQGEVLYLCLEGGKPLLKDRLRGMLPNSKPPLALTCAVDWPLLPEGGADELDRWLGQHPTARLVIVDTLQKVRAPTSGKLGAYEQDYAALQTLIALAQRYHVAILVCHHTRKSAADDVFDTVSGTLGLTGAVDALWVLQRVRGQDTAVLNVTGRGLPEQELGLHFDGELLTWRHVGAGKDARRSTERRLILQAMEADGGGPLTAREVADLTDGDYETVRKLLWLMERSGELRKEARGYVVPLP